MAAEVSVAGLWQAGVKSAVTVGCGAEAVPGTGDGAGVASEGVGEASPVIGRPADDGARGVCGATGLEI